MLSLLLFFFNFYFPRIHLFSVFLFIIPVVVLCAIRIVVKLTVLKSFYRPLPLNSAAKFLVPAMLCSQHKPHIKCSSSDHQNIQDSSDETMTTT